MALWFSGKEKKKNGDKEEEGEQERSIRIVVVGDGNVGKSSLIYALMTEQFPDEASLPSRKGERGGVDMMPSVLPEMRIPGKFNPDGIDVVLVDTPPEDPLPSLKGTTVKGADALILVYNATDDESFRRLSTHWLPRLTRWHGGPIVLAGNQIDQRGADLTNASLEQQILPLMAEFPTVETCIECSARALINVAEVFYFAVKSVMHPSQPLYGGAEHTLTPPCLRALQRIFRHIDADNDGYLDDGELTRFQEATFGTTLSANELRGIRESITATGCSEGVDARRGLSESGFLHLNKLFIQRGRLETTWTILRRFGYDASCCSFAVKGGAGAMGGHGDERIPEREGLTLNEAVLDVLPEAIGLTANTVLELTPSGWTHLRLLFDRFSTPNQDGLTMAELNRLFALTDSALCPWTCDEDFPNNVPRPSTGRVTWPAFQALWAQFCYDLPYEACRCFLELFPLHYTCRHHRGTKKEEGAVAMDEDATGTLPAVLDFCRQSLQCLSVGDKCRRHVFKIGIVDAPWVLTQLVMQAGGQPKGGTTRELRTAVRVVEEHPQTGCPVVLILNVATWTSPDLDLMDAVVYRRSDNDPGGDHAGTEECCAQIKESEETELVERLDISCLQLTGDPDAVIDFEQLLALARSRPLSTGHPSSSLSMGGWLTMGEVVLAAGVLLLSAWVSYKYCYVAQHHSPPAG